MNIKEFFSTRREEVNSVLKTNSKKTRVYLVRDEERYNHAMLTLDSITDLLFETASYGSLSVHPSDKSDTAIVAEIVTDSLRVARTEEFSRILSTTSNVEVLPRTDGFISMFITFEDVFTPCLQKVC